MKSSLPAARLLRGSALGVSLAIVAVSAPAFAQDAADAATADDPVIAENFDGPYQAMLVARGRRLCFPCAGRARDDATASRIRRAN